MEENVKGAERKPKGRAKLMKYFPCDFMPVMRIRRNDAICTFYIKFSQKSSPTMDHDAINDIVNLHLLN